MTTSSSSSSHQTTDGETTAAILSLGEQIAATLDEHDLLARWMAHYLAQQMAALESLRGRERAAAESEVADQILRLWEHRHGAALREEPIALSDSVQRAIARLDPEQLRPWGYYKPFDEKPGPSAAEIEVNTFLRVALELDRAMADLVRSLITYASMTAAAVDAKWLRMARTAGDDPLEQLRSLWEGLQLEGSDGHPTETERARIAGRAKNVVALLRLLEDDESATKPLAE